MLLDQIFRGASLSGGKLIAQFCQREGVTEEAFRFGLIGLYGRNREAPCWDGAVETIDAAKAAALADAGLAESDVTFTKEKLDWDDGIAVYDIEFLTADTEYDYEIDAATGAVLDKSAELLRPNESQGQTMDAGIGVESAKEIAAAHAGLSKEEAFFTKAELELEHGRSEYEIEFYHDRIEYEYTIDAATGAILEYKSEYDH